MGNVCSFYPVKNDHSSTKKTKNSEISDDFPSYLEENKS